MDNLMGRTNLRTGRLVVDLHDLTDLLIGQLMEVAQVDNFALTSRERLKSLVNECFSLSIDIERNELIFC